MLLLKHHALKRLNQNGELVLDCLSDWIGTGLILIMRAGNESNGMAMRPVVMLSGQYTLGKK